MKDVATLRKIKLNQALVKVPVFPEQRLRPGQPGWWGGQPRRSSTDARGQIVIRF